MVKIPKIDLNKHLKGITSKIPVEFRWLVFYALWEQISIPLPKLMRNRRAYQCYTTLKKNFPVEINKRYAQLENMIETAYLKGGLITEHERKELWDELEMAFKQPPKTEPEITIFNGFKKRITELKHSNAVPIGWLLKVKDFLPTMKNLDKKQILEALMLNEALEPTDIEKQEIIEGKKDQKIIKELKK